MRRTGGYAQGMIIGLTKYLPSTTSKAEHPYAGILSADPHPGNDKDRGKDRVFLPVGYSLRMELDRSEMLTEKRLPESMAIDTMPLEQAVSLMNAQDAIAVAAVQTQSGQIAAAVELVAASIGAGGRLIYVGAGTSGRLGVLDASECPPTFRSDPLQVQGIIAGGESAMFRAREGAEDSSEDGAAAVDEKQIDSRDVVMGIAAGGTTPFVHGALRQAAARGAGRFSSRARSRPQANSRRM